MDHPEVKMAAVVPFDRAPGMTLLAAFVVPTNGHAPNAEAIKSFLRKRIPAYMVPNEVVWQDAIPLLANGKVNRRALQIPDSIDASDEPVTQGSHNPLEETLVAIWRRVLGVQRISVHDSFFQLGGHSLLASRLVAEIRRDLGRQLALSAVFEAPTIEQLAIILEQPNQGKPWSPLVPIQPSGHKYPFFCVHGVGGGVWDYARLAELLGSDRPAYGLQARGLDGSQDPDTRIEDMAARYIQALTRAQPEGPIYLGGYSYGGYVAYEMAQQLRRQGREVAVLAMLDTPAPHSGYKRFNLTGHSLGRLIQNFPRWFGDFVRLRPVLMVGRLQRHLRLTASCQFPNGAPAGSGEIDLRDLFDDVDRIPGEIRRLMEVEIAALQQYQARPYLGRVTLLRAEAQPLFCSHDPAMGWGALALGGVDILSCPGSHHTLLREPHVRGLAAQLRSRLNSAERTTRLAAR